MYIHIYSNHIKINYHGIPNMKNNKKAKLLCWWCVDCQTPCVNCDICGNSSCISAGCEICTKEFEIAQYLIFTDAAPTQDKIPYARYFSHNKSK